MRKNVAYCKIPAVPTRLEGCRTKASECSCAAEQLRPPPLPLRMTQIEIHPDWSSGGSVGYVDPQMRNRMNSPLKNCAGVAESAAAVVIVVAVDAVFAAVRDDDVGERRLGLVDCVIPELMLK